MAWATMDEKIHPGEHRKVYFCSECKGYHVATERMRLDVPIPYR